MHKLFIVDDHRILRDGLRLVLSMPPARYEITGEAGTVEQCKHLLLTHQPELILLDWKLPDGNGLDLALWMQNHFPPTGIVMMSGEWTPGAIKRALDAGVYALIGKEAGASILMDALEAALQRKKYIDPAYTEWLLAGLEDPAGILSEREREVLILLASGRLYKEIASDLHISTRTVETHRDHLLQKLQLKSTAELIRFAIENKLL